MSILITAPIRTGKTLYTMKLIFEYLNKGRQVYTNIVGIKVDGVISVASSINDPFDWRNLPNGSVLVWDEAHEHPAFSEQDLLKTFKIDESHFDDLLQQLNSQKGITATQERQNIQKIEKAKKDALEKRKEEIRDIGRSLLLHGHFGIEIIFITQRPAKLNADVLASVTSHFIMRRKFGMDAAMIWEFGEAMTTWSKSTATYALNKTLWRYPKHLYKFYVSSENHQVRKSFPLKYIAFALVPLFLFGYGFTKAKETGFMGLFPKNEKNIQEHPQQYSTQNQQKQEQPQTLICNESNIESEQCKELAKTKNSQINPGTNLTNTVYYVPSDPYATQIQAVQELNDVDFPRLSGCVKYGGKYYGIDQQGNRMPTVKQETCKRWLNGERPFDYFKQQEQTQYQPQLTQIQPQQTEKLKQQDPEQFDAEYMAKMQEAKRQGLI